MANLTQGTRPQPYGQGGRKVFLPLSATAQVYEGAMVALLNGAVVTGTTALSGHCIGVAESNALGGATNGATRVVVWTDKIFTLQPGVYAPTDSTPYGTVLYMEDDNHVGTGGGSETQIAGRFMGIEDDGTVRVYFTNQASWFDGNAADGNVGYTYFARAVMTTTAVASYTGSGTGVLTGGSNAALVAQDGVTLAVGDVVMLQGGTLGSLAITAADVGPYVVTALGSGTAPFVLTRPSWWQNGEIVPTGKTVKIGPEGTLFGSTDWTSWAAPGCVIGTTDPKVYPDRVISQVTVTNGVVALANGTCPPLRSASKSVVIPTVVALASGSQTGITSLAPLAITPGYTGTAAVTITALGTALASETPTGTITANVLFVNR